MNTENLSKVTNTAGVRLKPNTPTPILQTNPILLVFINTDPALNAVVSTEFFSDGTTKPTSNISLLTECTPPTGNGVPALAPGYTSVVNVTLSPNQSIGYLTNHYNANNFQVCVNVDNVNGPNNTNVTYQYFDLSALWSASNLVDCSNIYVVQY